MRHLPLLAVLAPLALLAGCKTSGGPPLSEIAAQINKTLQPQVVVLSPGDEIEVRFPYAPTWNQVLPVAPDGIASFMGIGGLKVAGLSVEDARSNLIEAYAHILENPELNIVVTALAARSVYVMGEVEDPGEYLLGPDRRLTLVEALARAGGPLKQTAYLEHTLLVRRNAADGQQLSWKIDADEDYWTGTVPLYLQPYDVVYVPNTPIDDVAIWIDNYIRRMIPFPYLAAP